MLTYVVTTSRAELLDYCAHAHVHPRATWLVQTPADLATASIGEDRIVFWGRYRELPELAGIVAIAISQILETTPIFGPPRTNRPAAPRVP